MNSFSPEESLISLSNDLQIFLLGVINNSTKIFRLVGIYSRYTHSLGNFLTKFVFTGNIIITDQWAGFISFIMKMVVLKVDYNNPLLI